ncbi:MAG: hypothetical protein M1819_004895 [Sarea resinae]|nr:MAG: hypothetical protein M1819_004895 [Sarea resinae]
MDGLTSNSTSFSNSPSSSNTPYSGSDNLESYAFPAPKRALHDGAKTPLVLVACGSFSPPTILHMRMFEMACDYVRLNTEFEVVGGYLSPVNDTYHKAGLVIKMCEAACSYDDVFTVDPWEALQKEYQPTAVVLDHFNHEINIVNGGIKTPTDERKPARIALLAGADLIQTMSTPGLWSDKDLDHILRQYGVFVVERQGTDLEQALGGLKQWSENIFVIPQLVQNDISSTRIRLLLRRSMSVKWLIPAKVAEYIEKNGLFAGDGTMSPYDKGKDKGRQLGDATAGSVAAASAPR